MEFKFNEEKDILFYGENVDSADAYILFPKNEDGSHTITKVFVDPKLRGQGLAGKLMEYLLDYIKEYDVEYSATCSYAVNFLEKYGK